MDPDYPTTEIKEETDKHNEADASANAIKLEPPDPDVDYDSIKFEESKLKNWVESFASMSKTEFMEQEASKDGSQSAPHGDKLNIKLETDIGDHAGCDLLNRIKDEHNTEQWDELDQIADVAEQVKMEDLAAIGVKLEDKIELETQQDSTKTEDMDTTELTEELDIKPDETSDAEVDSAVNKKYWERGGRIEHKQAERELINNYNHSYRTRSKNGSNSHISASSCSLKADMKKSLTTNRNSNSRTKFFKCSHCDNRYRRKTIRDDHILKKHPNFTASVTRKIHECANCTYRTTNKTSFNYHMSKHSRSEGIYNLYKQIEQMF